MTLDRNITFRVPGELRDEFEKVLGEKRISTILRELVTGFIKQNRQNR